MGSHFGLWSSGHTNWNAVSHLWFLRKKKVQWKNRWPEAPQLFRPVPVVPHCRPQNPQFHSSRSFRFNYNKCEIVDSLKQLTDLCILPLCKGQCGLILTCAAGCSCKARNEAAPQPSLEWEDQGFASSGEFLQGPSFISWFSEVLQVTQVFMWGHQPVASLQWQPAWVWMVQRAAPHVWRRTRQSLDSFQKAKGLLD